MNAAEILGVAPDAPLEAVKQAYYALARRMHPDHGGRPADFARVRSAYETILDRRDPRRERTYQRPERARPGATNRPRDDTSTRTILKVHRQRPSERPEPGHLNRVPMAGVETRFSPNEREFPSNKLKDKSFYAAPPTPGARTTRFAGESSVWVLEKSFAATVRSKLEASRVLDRLEQVPGTLVFFVFLCLLTSLQGLGSSLSRTPGILQSVAVVALIAGPAGIASLLGADGHFGSRRIFIGVAGVLFVTFSVIASMSL